MSGIVRRAGLCLFGLVALLWTGAFLAQTIDLTNADLGRHLKTGELLSKALAEPSQFFKTPVLHTNFYSYTHPEFPVMNHHWGSGLALYEVYRYFGFVGLSVLDWVLLLAAWGLMLVLAVRRGGWGWAAVWLLWLMPCFTSRREVRPEMFSVFFAAVSVLCYELYRDKKISLPWLAGLLVVQQVLWTNLHIYFVLGPLIGLIYVAHGWLTRTAAQPTPSDSAPAVPAFCLVLVCAATLLNPFGIHGALYPFFIFGNYGYRIVENQSIPFLERLKVIMPHFSFFKTASIALASAILLDLMTRTPQKGRLRLPAPGAVLALFFAVMGWRAIRNIQLFSLFALPVLAQEFARWTQFRVAPMRWTRNVLMGVGAGAVLAATIVTFGGHPFKPMARWGAGAELDALQAAHFLKDENIHGPIFNNYDIGSYMIYSLWPDVRVFVDNRPEAYPATFFKDTLVPAQESDERWRELNKQYEFNAIVFNYRDLTEWAQGFLLRRISDPDWAPVYADQKLVVFVRRTVSNAPLIVRRELPASIFRVIPQS